MSQSDIQMSPRRSRHRRPKRGRQVFAIVSLLLVMCAIGLGVYFFLGRQPEQLVKESDTIPVSSQSSMSVMSSDSSVASSLSTSSQAKSETENPLSQKILSAFNATFGALKGDHALYYQRLSDATGHTVQEQPVIVNQSVLKSASIIKLFILSAAFRQSEAGIFDLSASYELAEADIVGGTGNIQSLPIGTVLTNQDLVEAMIVTSDNTATNILIEHLGGIEAINREIKQLGYQHSKLQRLMLDFEAITQGRDNEVAVQEVGDFMQRLMQGKVVSKASDEVMLKILREQQDHSNLESAVIGEATFYNKTGSNTQQGIRHDASIVQTPSGQYVLVVLSQAGEDASQQQAMQQFGQQVYQIINQQ